LLALINTGPFIEVGTSIGTFNHKVLIVGKGLHGMP
jgi:hypothetical protein